MGKSRILSGGSDGLYTVERVYDRTFYEQEKADLEAEIANIDARLAQANDQLDAIEAQATEADQALKEAQDLYVEAVRNRNENPDAEWIDPSTGETVDDPSVFYMDQLERTMESVAEVYTARAGLKNDIALMEAAKLSAEKRIEQMDAVADPAPESAWCADLVENASGEVATIEIPGEPQKLLVAPQHASGAGEPVGGTLMPREWMTGPQAFFNAAILPGWQRWKPTYRVGVIQGLDYDNDTCSVRIEGALSTAQDLYINSLEHAMIEDVPVQYMDCNSSAFEDGDRVVVRLSGMSWGSALVVGFASSPKDCWPHAVGFLPSFSLGDWQSGEETEENAHEVSSGSHPEDGPYCYASSWVRTPYIQYRKRDLTISSSNAILYGEGTGGAYMDHFDVTLVSAHENDRHGSPSQTEFDGAQGGWNLTRLSYRNNSDGFGLGYTRQTGWTMETLYEVSGPIPRPMLVGPNTTSLSSSCGPYPTGDTECVTLFGSPANIGGECAFQSGPEMHQWAAENGAPPTVRVHKGEGDNKRSRDYAIRETYWDQSVGAWVILYALQG